MTEFQLLLNQRVCYLRPRFVVPVGIYVLSRNDGEKDGDIEVNKPRGSLDKFLPLCEPFKIWNICI